MRARSLIAAAAGLDSLRTPLGGVRPGLGFCFFAPGIYLWRHAAMRVSASFPGAAVIGCSTGGEIGPEGASDGLVSLLGLAFDSVTVRTHRVPLDNHARSASAGHLLGDLLLSSSAPAAVLPFVP